mgnify:CR=1 FL=1
MSIRRTVESLSGLIQSINGHLRKLGGSLDMSIAQEPIQYTSSTKYRISVRGPYKTEIIGRPAKIRDAEIRLLGIQEGLRLARDSISNKEELGNADR